MKIKKNAVVKIAESRFWSGIILIASGMAISIPSLFIDQYIPGLTAVSLFVAGISTIFFNHSLNNRDRSSVKYMTGGTLLAAGIMVLFYRQAGMQVIATISGGFLILTTMLVLWLSVRAGLKKSWNILLFSGLFAMLLGPFMFLLWPENGNTYMTIMNGLILIVPGLLLIHMSHEVEDWESEVRMDWDKDFMEDMNYLQHELLRYQVELMEIKFAVKSMREELNDKLSLDNYDPDMMRLSRNVSDLQENLKFFEKFTEKIFRQIGNEDSSGSFLDNDRIQHILADLKDQYDEVLKIYMQNMHHN